VGVGERRDAHRGFVGKSDKKKPLVKYRHGWEDNIKMDLQELGKVMDWIDRFQYRDR
jgi:hypothetical protein